jgi:hypothetical protein
MADDLRVSANKPPAIQAIEIELRISKNEPSGIAQRNDNFTSPTPILPFEKKLKTKYMKTAENESRKFLKYIEL